MSPMTYDPLKTICIVGYPKSGNTWITRLIADAIDSPIRPLYGGVPLATEGKDRKGEYSVHQLHLRPIWNGPNIGIVNEFQFNISGWQGEKIVFIYRDPRDVMVSLKYYWNYPHLMQMIEDATTGHGVCQAFGSWQGFHDAWTEAAVGIAASLSYESLIEKPVETLLNTLICLDIPPVKSVSDVVKRQSFEEKRKQIEIDGDDRPHGKGIQLQNLRKGIVGDWRNHFRRAEGKVCHNAFWTQMETLKYETDIGWWEKLPV